MTSTADGVFQQALAAMQSGKLDIAEGLFKQVLQLQPEHLPALDVFSILLAGQGRPDEAEYYARRVLAAYDRFLQLKPNLAEPWLGRAHVLSRLARNREAIESCDRAVAAKPDFIQAHLLRAKLLSDLRRQDEALAGIDTLLEVAPNLAEAWLGRSNVLFELKRFHEALAACERALALKPGLGEAWLGRGNVLNEIKRYDDALTAFDKALASNPQLIGAWLGRGNVLTELKRYDDALAAYDKELASSPGVTEAWLGRGNVLNVLRRYQEGFAAFDQALALNPSLPEAWLGRGNALFGLRRYDDAPVAYDKALALKPDLAGAWAGRSNVFHKLKRHAEAVEACINVLKFDPQYPYAKGMLLHQKMIVCDWGGVEKLAEDIERDIGLGKLAAEPFGWQAASRSPRSLQLCAELFNADKFPANIKIAARAQLADRKKIRIGYLGDVFREQAVAYLLVGVMELHDRSRFEIYGFDNGWDDKGETRKRIDAASQKMIDISSRDDASAAAAVREHQIDILVNLNTYFGDHRTGVFAQRPAPIQVNYLGFPATLGASYSDYIVADREVIPPSDRQFYTEKVVYLPDSYQANDRKRAIAARNFSRTECGLPQSGSVFCCFNNNFKITAEVFDRWMRILRNVGGSVLWLVEDNAYVAANLRKEANSRGVNGERLIFAKRMPLADHLARHRSADLFLDTLPYNAHTTASDALWAGLPVLTLIGETFPGRVAASLLHAIGLAELIAATPEAYEGLAVELATNPEKLAALKQKLENNRLTMPLFDTQLYARRLDAAYTAMYERYQAGLAPDHIQISD
jgi:protein O-GlcNAc transferase